ARKFTNLRLKNKICNYYSETKKISFDNNNFPFIPPVLRQSPYRNYRYYQDLNKICNNEVNLDNYYKKFANTKSFVYPNLPKPVEIAQNGDRLNYQNKMFMNDRNSYLTEKFVGSSIKPFQ
ncbi:hypothetical protein MHBO_003812, partial [Bonamia ostreae]